MTDLLNNSDPDFVMYSIFFFCCGSWILDSFSVSGVMTFMYVLPLPTIYNIYLLTPTIKKKIPTGILCEILC